ncbi:2122_t:CDS:2 [Entrophospora sp. SA101]|nr:2122_t:CDS:2 [Entrophospora sp. SA101]
MSFYCFETRQDRTLAPYPPPEFSQHVEKMSPNEIVDHIIQTNIDPMTLKKIENQIAVPLKQLISPRENRRRRCIPRPQNNFVLYRRNFHAVITKERGHAVAKNFKLISNMAAKNWAEESNEIKQLYELIADCAKKVHDCTYPQYVYQPKHKSSKKGNNNIFREVKWRWLNYNQSNTIIPSTNMEIEHQSQSQIQPQFQLPSQTSTTLSSYTELLPPIDIPISSNFLAAYDRSLWDKFRMS